MDPSSMRTLISGYIKYIAISAIVIFAILPLAALGSKMDLSSSSLRAKPAPIVVEDSETANEQTLTLETLSVSPLGVEASFSLTLPSTVANSAAPNILGPIFPEEQFHVLGFASRQGTAVVQQKLHHQGDAILDFDLFLGPIADISKGATITFDRIPLISDEGQSSTNVSGPWTFALAPSTLRPDDPISTREVSMTTQHHGVSVTVSRVESRPSGLYVYYSVQTQTSDPIDPVFTMPRLMFKDGSSAHASAVGSLAEGGNQGQQTTGDFVAAFNPVNVSGTGVQLEFGPYVTSNDQVASVTIQRPTGAWSADPILIDGERLGVSQVEYDAGQRRLVITVANTEPVKTASVLFLGVEAQHSIVAVDQDGRKYQYQSASTGMRRESDAVLGAGTSTFEFDGIDDTVQQLTLTVDHSGILLRGPWSVPLQLP